MAEKKSLIDLAVDELTTISENNLEYGYGQTSLLSEAKTNKWIKTDPKKKGMWKGWSVAELKAELNRLKKKEKKTEATKTREHEIEFALRAKKGHGFKNEEKEQILDYLGTLTETELQNITDDEFGVLILESILVEDFRDFPFDKFSGHYIDPKDSTHVVRDLSKSERPCGGCFGTGKIIGPHAKAGMPCQECQGKGKYFR